MNDQIMVLAELQMLDSEVLEYGKKLEEIPRKKTSCEEQQSQLTGRKTMLEDARNKAIEEKEAKEKEIEQEEQKIKTVESRLGSIRSPRDYQDVKKKLELARKANKLREEEVLKMMETIEKLKEEMTQFMTGYDEEKAGFESTCALYDNEAKELQAKYDELVSKRDSIAKKLTPENYSKYEMLRENCRGIAVSFARNESCEGCFMNLPPQLYNMVIKGDKLYNCPFCQRFLIYIPDKKEESGTAEK